MNCIICYEEKPLVKTFCQHKFCKECLFECRYYSYKCPLCRGFLKWDYEQELILFLKKHRYSNIPIDLVYHHFFFYFTGKYSLYFPLFTDILFLLPVFDKKDYSFQKIIDSVKSKTHPILIFIIFIRETNRFQQKSSFRKFRNNVHSFFLNKNSS